VAARNRNAVSAAIAFAAFACRGEAPDARPEMVVEHFVEQMQRVHGDGRAARSAYDLLWSEAKKNLVERAKRASAVAGHTIGPEEMIAPSRFSLNYKPKRYVATTEGDWAVVTAVGEGPGEQRKQIHCVREDAGWRVVLELPPLPPIQRRPDAGP
jgi:hypothetical protein